MTAHGSWVEFWNRPDTAIYVNRRNLEVHFASIRDGLMPLMPEGGTALDYGCGDALAAGELSLRCDRLALYDAAPAVRRRLAERYADHPRIRVLDDAALAAAQPGSFDLITVVSVLQYVPRAELPRLLALWRDLLAENGRLVIADVVTPDTPLVRDVASQLGLAARNGFLVPALAGIVRLALSDYRRIRRTAGFSTYDGAEMLRLLAEAGLAGERLARNIGPTPHRISFVARRAAGQPAAAKVQ